jgi:hypothetical protein
MPEEIWRLRPGGPGLERWTYRADGSPTPVLSATAIADAAGSQS